jgi:hypothetical protein
MAAPAGHGTRDAAVRHRREAGRSGGGNAYDYRVVRRLGTDGQPVTGERAPDPNQAAVVQRIFRDYAAGLSPKRIALALNAVGVAGPRGGAWSASTINGNRARGTGILNNELYVGRLVWDRLAYIKDPDTGRRRSRKRLDAEQVVTEVPDLRIIDGPLWDAVKARQAALDRHDRDKRKPTPRCPRSLLVEAAAALSLLRAYAVWPEGLGRQPARSRRKMARSASESICRANSAQSASGERAPASARRTSSFAMGPRWRASARVARSASSVEIADSSIDEAGAEPPLARAPTARRNRVRSAASSMVRVSAAQSSSADAALRAPVCTRWRAIGPT